MKGVKQLKEKKEMWSNEVGHIHRHLVHLRVVELLNVLQHALVVTSDEIDGNSFAAEPATTPNPAKNKQGLSEKLQIRATQEFRYDGVSYRPTDHMLASQPWLTPSVASH